MPLWDDVYRFQSSEVAYTYSLLNSFKRKLTLTALNFDVAVSWFLIFQSGRRPVTSVPRATLSNFDSFPKLVHSQHELSHGKL